MKKDINFFEAVLHDKTLRNVDLKKGLLRSLIICGGFVVIMTIALMIMVQMSKAKINDLERQLQLSAPDAKMQVIAEAKSRMETLAAENQGFIASLQQFNAAPSLKTSDIQNIAMCQTPDMIVNSFSYDKGVVTMNCAAQTELSGVIFVNRLRITKLFDGVVYTGVSFTGSEYAFSVTFNIRGEEVASDNHNEQ